MPNPAVPLSLAHLSELAVAPAELIPMAARAGFASVGLRTAPAAPGGVAYPLATASEQAAIRRLVADSGTSVVCVELISLSEATDPAAHARMLEIGAAIGASRVVVAGDSADRGLVADKLAAIASIAQPLGLAIDLEFMPFRGIRSFEDAMAVLDLAEASNAHILVDALHVYRSGSALAAIATAPRTRLGTFQLCDAPAKPPPPEGLVVEARTHRLPAGEGGLPLGPLLDVMPDDVPIGVEVPMATLRPDLGPAERLALLARMTQDYLAGRRAG
ncbi:MAG: TIM barrel protein [Hyphomicrobiaceae bacterium]